MSNNDCSKLADLSRAIQRANFIRRAAFPTPHDACQWAEYHAHDAFSAFVEDGRTILVQPLSLELSWVWTEHVCPVHPPTSRVLPGPEPISREAGRVANIRADIMAGAYDPSDYEVI